MRLRRPVGTVTGVALRIPIGTASAAGIAAVVETARTQTVILTRHGQAMAAVYSVERLEAQTLALAEVRLAVLDAAAHLSRAGEARLNLDTACARLGIDPERVREHARRHAQNPCSGPSGQ